MVYSNSREIFLNLFDECRPYQPVGFYDSPAGNYGTNILIKIIHMLEGGHATVASG